MLADAVTLLQAEHPGHELRNYTSLDCETTGFNLHEDLILELGLVVVRDGKVLQRKHIVLDWTKQPEVQLSWLSHRLARVKHHFEKTPGKIWRIDLAYVKRGVPPAEGLTELAQTLRQQREVGGYFVGHGLLRFDGFRVQKTLEEWLGWRWRFGKRELVDTLAFARADLCPVPKRAGETLFDYSQRVLNVATHVKASLDKVCLPRYRLDTTGELAGSTHTSITDAELSRRLLVRLVPSTGDFL